MGPKLLLHGFIAVTTRVHYRPDFLKRGTGEAEPNVAPPCAVLCARSNSSLSESLLVVLIPQGGSALVRSSGQVTCCVGPRAAPSRNPSKVFEFLPILLGLSIQSRNTSLRLCFLTCSKTIVVRRWRYQVAKLSFHHTLHARRHAHTSQAAFRHRSTVKKYGTHNAVLEVSGDVPMTSNFMVAGNLRILGFVQAYATQ